MKPIITVAMLGAFFIGCRPQSLTPQRVCGTYQGGIGALSERIAFMTNGTFSHSVKISEQSVLTETGVFTIDKGRLRLEPFTMFFDRGTGSMIKSGEQFEVYYLYFFTSPPSDSIKVWADANYELSRIRNAK